jgi:Polyphosphate kinase 2 (PPK2)
VPDAGSTTLSTEQVAQLLRLLRRVKGVELKLSVADGDRRSAVAALGMDPLEAQIRQVAFLDTPELTLHQRGIVVRVRRIQRKPGDSVVKLRPLHPEELPPELRKSRDLSLEVDAMPGGFVCRGAAGPSGMARSAEAAQRRPRARFLGRPLRRHQRWERHLDQNGTKIVKFFLHVSKAEQKRRFMARLDKRHKQWKFNAADVAERAHWDEYMQAYEDAITATSTEWAPWYVLPADHKHVMQAMAAAIIVDTIGVLDLRWPTVSDEAGDANAKARVELEAEAD